MGCYLQRQSQNNMLSFGVKQSMALRHRFLSHVRISPNTGCTQRLHYQLAFGQCEKPSFTNLCWLGLPSIQKDCFYEFFRNLLTVNVLSHPVSFLCFYTLIFCLGYFKSMFLRVESRFPGFISGNKFSVIGSLSFARGINCKPNDAKNTVFSISF